MFLGDIAEFGVGKTLLSTPGKTIMGNIRRKYGKKGALAAGLTSAGLITGGHIAAQQSRKRHAEKTQKQKEK